MVPNGKIIYLWGAFLALGVILFSMQIYHTYTQIQKHKQNQA